MLRIRGCVAGETMNISVPEWLWDYFRRRLRKPLKVKFVTTSPIGPDNFYEIIAIDQYGKCWLKRQRLGDITEFTWHPISMDVREELQ